MITNNEVRGSLFKKKKFERNGKDEVKKGSCVHVEEVSKESVKNCKHEVPEQTKLIKQHFVIS